MLWSPGLNYTGALNVRAYVVDANMTQGIILYGVSAAFHLWSPNVQPSSNSNVGSISIDGTQRPCLSVGRKAFIFVDIDFC